MRFIFGSSPRNSCACVCGGGTYSGGFTFGLLGGAFIGSCSSIPRCVIDDALNAVGTNSPGGALGAFGTERSDAGGGALNAGVVPLVMPGLDGILILA